jgi:dihydrofolate synthase/folylpolyglutamate synthase
MINTKDVDGFLRPISKHCQSLAAVTIPNEPNAVPAVELAKAGNACGLTCNQGEDIHQLLDTISKLYPHSRILICGSLYLAGHVLRENKNPN